MDSTFYNIFLDGVVRKVKARVLQRSVKLCVMDGNGWEVNQPLFADYCVLVGDLGENFLRLMDEFGRVSKKKE